MAAPANVPLPSPAGSVQPISPFDPEKAAEQLRKAMKGLDVEHQRYTGTDEDAVIGILASHCVAQRIEIEKKFKTMYGRDLQADLKSELSGKLEDVVLMLLEHPRKFDAKQCNEAIKGLGTDEDALIEILTTRSNAEIAQIRDIYRTTYKRELERDIQADTSGDFKRLLVSLVTGNREERAVADPALAHKEADELFKAGEQKLGTDESTFNRILCLRSNEQLRATFAQYKALAGKDIEASIKSEMSGNLEQGFLAIVKSAQSPPAYFAERLYNSMKGAGTNDKALKRLIVSRAEVDMNEIKRAFVAMFGKSLHSFIKGDTSGDYRKILLALVKD